MSWTESVGLTLIKRDLYSMQLLAPNGSIQNYSILQVFPFTSESKRMGIIVKVSIYCKGCLNHHISSIIIWDFPFQIILKKI